MALTDAVGAVAATYKYDDWGNLLSSTGSISIPFGYRGRFGYVYDKETGLYFLKSRYYDPETGRFTTNPTTYTYNPNYQLTNVTKPNGDTIGFTYDGDNRRLSKTVNGAKTSYVYAGSLPSPRDRLRWVCLNLLSTMTKNRSLFPKEPLL